MIDDQIEVEQAVDDAASAYEAFHGVDAEVVSEMEELPDVYFKVGDAVGIVYEVVENGQTVRYQHDFEARPTLAVSSDGRIAVILRGEWHFTERGFEG